ncbi:hypothetical protein OG866_39175 [Streptomyces sp. NBC_00663]|uniref:DUF6777 domain-containing protein n=1 Tax=Streptomyces sp. NBC_00663 TaxID=2975801 RepID=UPI002E3553BD|nr:DUF6777 domain-containing protein [Streptomyces sp. NBC_00663]
MRTGTFVTVCALSAALIVVGCAGGNDTENGTRSSGEIFLQPIAAQGPDPFTASTATATATAAPITRTQQPRQSGDRSISGGTPGLYGGTARTGSCDVNRQIDQLTADPAKGRAFAQVAGVAQASIPTYLRSLTSVVLRADTRVTNHGYRGGRATDFPSVLQAGTAVLVDNRGVPRVRCACGNPLTSAAPQRGNPGTKGRAWSGFGHDQVIVVTPAPQVITHITIIDLVDNTWIERRCGHDARHDHVVPRPEPLIPTTAPTATPTPTPSPSRTGSGTSVRPGESEDSASPSDEQRLTTDCATPTVTVTPGVPLPATPGTQDPACPAATATAPSPTTAPQTPTAPDTPSTAQPTDTGQDIGPETVPDTPDLPDGGGLVPDSPDEPVSTDSIFDSPTDVFGS